MLKMTKNTKSEIKKLLGKIINGEKVQMILAEEKIDFKKEYYFSVSYSSETRGPVITFSEKGGTGIEDRGADVILVDPLTQKFNESKFPKEVLPIIPLLLKAFFENDFLLLEINPLVLTTDNKLMALDAKIKLEDSAKSRHLNGIFHQEIFQDTWRQRVRWMQKDDEGDYRGTAGAAFFDLPGDIAVLSSGGGVSLTALDALIANGGKPANFTEYSGNPPKEKVAKLTKIVLDKPNIHGLWVIGTVVANFTDIYETLSGIIEGLRQAEKELKTKFDFPIVIRRGARGTRKLSKCLRKLRILINSARSGNINRNVSESYFG